MVGTTDGLVMEEAAEVTSLPATSAFAEEIASPDHGASVFLTAENSSQATPSDSQGTSTDCGENDRIKSYEIIAQGIASVLGPVMNNFDAGVEGALKSQSVLSSSFDRLTRELDKLLEDAPLPFVTHHATKISGIRKRVVSLITSLRIIQKRIDNIERLLSGYAMKTPEKVRCQSSDINEGLVSASLSQALPAGSSYVEVPSVESPPIAGANTYINDDDLVSKSQSVYQNTCNIPESEGLQLQIPFRDSSGSNMNGFTDCPPLKGL